MNHVADAARIRTRAALLWAAVTAGTAAFGRLALDGAGELLTAPGPDFASLLVQACSVVGLVALAALWLITTDVVRQVVHTPAATADRASSRRPGPLRTLLLTACGVAVLSGTTTAAAFAHDGPDAPLTAATLDGLPLPDRATGAGPTPQHDGPLVRVHPGDSLWAIAARALGPTASEADVASYWRRIHALNLAVIGTDPDLVRPAQQLRLPPR